MQLQIFFRDPTKSQNEIQVGGLNTHKRVVHFKKFCYSNEIAIV